MNRIFASLFSLISLGVLVGLGVVFGVIVFMGRDLPSHESLQNYHPPMLTRVYARDGEPIAEYLKERRFFVPIDEMPELMKQAVIAAEDKNFYSHPGFDIRGIVSAVIDAAQGKRLRGASTLTQQVVKNFLLSSDRALERKVKELILAFRIEQVMTKDQIFELYLNEFELGAWSFGFPAAAQNYFGKNVDDLEIHEVAYLAALLKGPSVLHPVRYHDEAVDRRNYVIGRMEAVGFITPEAAETARAQPLETLLDGSIESSLPEIPDANHFTAEVRRQLVEELGAQALAKHAFAYRIDGRSAALMTEAIGVSVAGGGVATFERLDDIRAKARILAREGLNRGRPPLRAAQIAQLLPQFATPVRASEVEADAGIGGRFMRGTPVYALDEDGAEALSEMLGEPVAATAMLSADARAAIVRKLGEKEVLAGGLSVRATINARYQEIAENALRDRLVSWDIERRGWRGPFDVIPEEKLGTEADWRAALAELREIPRDIDGWRPAVVLLVGNNAARVGIEGVEEDADGHFIPVSDFAWARPQDEDGELGPRPTKPGDILSVGDVVFVTEKRGDDGAFEGWSLRQIPRLQGAFVAMDALTGRVLAMTGGFSYQTSVFNRATQAKRQPGSSFKPFVYAAALDNGYTPSTIILDAPITIDTGADELWRPQNASRKFYGPSPMRVGIEQSRNVMTVRLAQEIGMDRVADYAERFGVYRNMPHHLSYALGAGETTLYQMVSAYAVFANGGLSVEPTLVDRVQDRRGRTIWRHEPAVCEGCAAPVEVADARAGAGVAADAAAAQEPWVRPNARRVMDPVTAYQLTSMMQGVVQRGTARRLASLDMPLAGKTGTTNDARDVWFLGFTPDIVVGCFIGYDTPTPIGRGAAGGSLCAPVAQSFLAQVKDDRPVTDFQVPETAVGVKVDRFSGVRLPDDATGEHVVIEAFHPEDVPQVGQFTGEGVIGGELAAAFMSGEGDLPMRAEDAPGEGAAAPVATGAEDGGGAPRPPRPGAGGGFGSGGLY
ncbi:penicillin-binding protein 1A [Rhodovulum sp. DZ06]|uniref:penicillin-binding protein 1A n=1 Tax=Rhodovulum sp. DZ06 TaxID=3425126 RepID=UPI003D353456